MQKNMRRVRKEDYNRVVLTESCPYEVPLIFSNFNFYRILNSISKKISNDEAIVYKKVLSKTLEDHTIPLKYSIRKDEDSFRHLSLIHPASQVEAIELYKEFAQQIISSCKKSNFSIRRPGKVASKYHIASAKNANLAYRSPEVATTSDEKSFKYLTSYYSYNGYKKLHEFFDSKDFFRLEKKYLHFWSLDVTQCFDSIYTHSISWALKSKDFAKSHKNEKNTLGSCFDRIMQSANYNETSGIVIGPEMSRIFSEIIFQEIDLKVEKGLLEESLRHGEDYDIRRYVDDYYIFSSNKETCKKVQRRIERELKEFKLNINTNKTLRLKRPFVTGKTSSLRRTKEITSTLLEKILDTHEEKGGETKNAPRLIKKPNRLLANFINDIKASCIHDPKAYELASNYIVISLSNTLIRVTKDNEDKSLTGKSSEIFEKFYSFIIELVFHFFTISPNYSSSTSICKVTHASCEFYSKKFTEESETIKSLLYTHCLDFLKSGSFSKISNEHPETHLEILNIIIAMRLLGDDFLIPRDILENTLNRYKKNEFSYFEIITLLFYIQNNIAYRGLKKEIESAVKNKLKDMSDISENSEKAYLVFDALSCPYIHKKTKRILSESLLSAVFRSKTTRLTPEELIATAEKWGWFSSWDEVSILKNLEKKQLLTGY